MMWALFAVLLSVNIAIFSEFNRYFKLDGFRLNFWRMLIACIILLPVMLYVKWPAPSLFYPMAMLTGVTMVIGQALRFNLAAQHNGRVAVLYQPIAAFVGFFLWLITSQTALNDFISAPVKMFGVVLCFGFAVAGMAAIRRNDAGWKALVTVAPLGIMYGVMDVLAKYVLHDIDVSAYGIVYIFVTFLSAVIISATMLAVRPNQHQALCPPNMIRAAGVLALLGIFGFTCYVHAIAATPNPGYVTAITMLTPVWLMLYHKARGFKDDASPMAGLIMVIAALGLVLIKL